MDRSNRARFVEPPGGYDDGVVRRWIVRLGLRGSGLGKDGGGQGERKGSRCKEKMQGRGDLTGLWLCGPLIVMLQHININPRTRMAPAADRWLCGA